MIQNFLITVFLLLTTCGYSSELVMSFSKAVSKNEMGLLTDFDSAENDTEQEESDKEDVDWLDDLYIHHRFLQNHINPTITELGNTSSKQYQMLATSDYKQEVYAPPEI